MELIKLLSTGGGDVTDFTQAVSVAKYDSLMWVERYRKAGEFEIKAKVSSGLKDSLPIGSFISHVDTMEVMVVENHEIEESNDSEPELIITGRSMETILENRVVGSNQAFGTSYLEYNPVELTSAYPNTHAKTLINDHITTSSVYSKDEFLAILADTPTINAGVQEIRVINRGNLYEAVLELLGLADLGIRVIRKHGSLKAAWTNVNETLFYIHKGTDQSSKVRFSSDSGDFKNAKYFWSNRRLYNAALVSGQYIETMVEQDSPDAANYARRVLLVDGSDIDRDYDPGLTAGEKTAIMDRMKARGRQALYGKNDVALVSVNISASNQYKYRRDYDIGDLVGVYGSYGAAEKMRIVEHVEVEDERGQISYPTLGAIEL